MQQLRDHIWIQPAGYWLISRNGDLGIMATTEQFSTTSTTRKDVLRLHLKQMRAREVVTELLLNQGEHSLGSDHRSDHLINHPGIAPLHCTIVVEADRATIKSFDKHTWLNEGPVKQAKLKQGDRLLIGPLEYEVHCSYYQLQPEPTVIPEPIKQQTPAPVIDIHPLLHALSIAMERGKVPESARPLIDEPKPAESSADPGSETAIKELTSLKQELMEAIQETKQQLSQQRQQLDTLVVSAKVPAEQETVRINKSLELNQQLEQRLAEIKERENSLLKQQHDYQQQLAQLNQEQQQNQAAWKEQLLRFQDQQQALSNQENSLRELAQQLDKERLQIAARDQALSQQQTAFKHQQDALILEQQTLANQQLEISRVKSELDAQKDALSQESNRLSSLAPSMDLLLPQNIQRLDDIKRLENELKRREEDLVANQLEVSQRQRQLDRRSATLLENEEALNQREAEFLQELQSKQLKRKELELELHNRQAEHDKQEIALSAKAHALDQRETSLNLQAEKHAAEHQGFLRNQEEFQQAQQAWQQQVSTKLEEFKQQSELLHVQSEAQKQIEADLNLKQQDLDHRLQIASQRELELVKFEQELQQKQQTTTQLEQDLQHKQQANTQLELELQHQQQTTAQLEQELQAKLLQLKTHEEELSLAQGDQDLVRSDLQQRLTEITSREIEITKLEQELKQQRDTLDASSNQFALVRETTDHDQAELKSAQQALALARQELDQQVQQINQQELELNQRVIQHTHVEQELKLQQAQLQEAQHQFAQEKLALETQQAELQYAQEDQELTRQDVNRRLQDVTQREFELINLHQEHKAKELALTAVPVVDPQAASLMETEQAALRIQQQEIKSKEEELNQRDIELSQRNNHLEQQSQEFELSQAKLTQNQRELEAQQKSITEQQEALNQQLAAIQTHESDLATAQAEFKAQQSAWELAKQQTIEPEVTQFMPCYDSESARNTADNPEFVELKLKHADLTTEVTNLRGVLQAREVEFQELLAAFDKQQELVTELQAAADQPEQTLIDEIEEIQADVPALIDEKQQHADPITPVLNEELTEYVSLSEPDAIETSALSDFRELLELPTPVVEEEVAAAETNMNVSPDSIPMSQVPLENFEIEEDTSSGWSLFNSIFGATTDEEPTSTSNAEIGPQVTIAEETEPTTNMLNLPNESDALSFELQPETQSEPLFNFSSPETVLEAAIPVNETPEEQKARLFREELKSLFGMKSPVAIDRQSTNEIDSEETPAESAQIETEEPADFTQKWLQNLKHLQDDDSTITESLTSDDHATDSETFHSAADLNEANQSPQDVTKDDDQNQPPSDTDDTGEDEESVAKYMERLLARSRGWQSADAASPQPQKKDDQNNSAQTQALQSADKLLPQAEIEQKSAVGDETQVTPTPRPVIDKDVVRKNLDEFRQVAINNARNSIAKHSRKKMQNKIQIDLMLIVVSSVVSLGLFSSPLWTNQSYYIYAMIAAGIGIFATLELMRTHYKLSSITKHQETASE